MTAILVLACAARAQQSTGEGHSTAHAAATVADWAHARNDSARAFSAAMEGRKAETLAAVQSVVLTVPLDSALATGSGWNLTQQYAALVRFGLWDELLALRAPDPRASGLTAGYLYGRGVALAARGRLGEARTILGELQRLGAAAAPDARAGTNTLRDIVAVAAPVVAARIAATEQRADEAIALLTQAVAAEDRLAYDQPADWFFPVRHLLGAQLLQAGRAAQAERVYRADLQRNPANGWSLYGLAAALTAQRRGVAAARAARKFDSAWEHADVRLATSAFWFSGPDTTSCECQRESSGDVTAPAAPAPARRHP